MTENPKFELSLVGATDPHTFTAFVSNEAGERLAEHTFEWRSDSTALHMDLGELARTARSSQPPKDDLHIRFGQRLFHTIFDGPVAELWQAGRKQAKRSP